MELGYYLSTCSLCIKSYEENLNPPKTLPCSHSFCLHCIQALTPPPLCHITCPKCKRNCKVPGGWADSHFPTNLYALNILQLLQNKSVQFWCLTCASYMKPLCQYDSNKCHKVVDLRVISKRAQNIHLKEPSVGQNSNAKLGSTTDPKVITNRVKRMKRFSDETLERYSFLQPVHCKDLQANKKVSYAVTFSDDGSLLVSGGVEKHLILWRTGDIIHDRDVRNPKSCIRTENCIISLAITPDNSRIFSGGFGGTFQIHDTQTSKNISFIPHSFGVKSISLQPNSSGNICAVACWDRTVRIYDLRKNLSDDESSFVTVKRPGAIVANVMFSPVEPMHLLFAGQSGAHVIDMRNTKSYVYSIRCNGGLINNAQFNADGTRLLCKESKQPIAIYTVPPIHQSVDDAEENLRFGVNWYKTRSVFSRSISFAGKEDELVVSASFDNKRLFVWPIPPTAAPGEEEGKWIVDQPLFVLEGHKKEIACIKFNRQNSLLASSDHDGVVKVWNLSNQSLD